MTVEQQAYFNLRWATLALPLSPSVVAVAAVVLVWVAFLRAEWSDRTLFSAAAILSSTVLLGGTDELIYRLFHHWYGSTMVSASVTTYFLLLLISHHARKPIPAVLSILAIVYALFLPYYAMYDSILDIAGGVLFAAAVLCLNFFIAERAGVRPFAAPQ